MGWSRIHCGGGVLRGVAAVLFFGSTLGVASLAGASIHTEQPAEDVPHTEALEYLAASAEDIMAELRAARSETDALLRGGPFSLVAEAIDPVDARLREKLRLNLAVAYTTLYQGATRAPRPTAGGAFELFGVWVLWDGGDHEFGFLGFQTAAWQRFTDVAPGNLGSEIGVAIPTATDFTPFSFSLTQLYWEQQVAGGQLAFRIGKLDMDDSFDDYWLKGVDFYFVNNAFSSNPAIALPARGLGVIGSVDLGRGFYLLAGASDAEARDNGSGVSTAFDDSRFFTIGEIGWDGVTNGLGEAEAHLTVWNSPAVPGQDRGWGIATTTFQEFRGIVPFARYSYSAGQATGLRHLASLGLGLDGLAWGADDAAGIALAWAKPSEGTARSQVSGEIFYRLQVTPHLQLTPGYQIFVTPSFDRTRDVVGLVEVRARVTF